MSSFRALMMCGALMTLTGCGFVTKNKSSLDNSNIQKKEWTLVWSDEFNGTQLDTKKWVPETSCWGGGNNERQCYTKRSDNISVGDGVLKLKAKAEDFTGLKYPQDRAERGGLVRQNYTSGKVKTKGLANWKYGRFEARVKLPQGQSTWPAFWMLPEDNKYGQWPLSGEVDIMEAVNLGAECHDCKGSTTENRSSVALHFGLPWPDNQFNVESHILPNGPLGYHVFALEWSEGQMDWFVNEQRIFTMTHSDWFTKSVSKKDNKFAPFDQAFYVLLNLAVGGNLPDNRNEKSFNPNSFPSELLVDWVRVYQCQDDIKTSKKCLSEPD